MQSIVRARSRSRESNLPTTFGVGLAVSAAAELLLLAAAAALTASGTIGEGAMLIAAAVCAFLAAFIGAFVCAVKAAKLSLPLAVGVGAALFAVNFALGLLLPEGCGFSVAMPAAFLGGAVLAGVLAVMKKGGK